ncbi:MAG: Holliday junction resolvase RuvX [Proteobacteria bacterium]|nr:Holliday junction resolvase RuvX [Pseudomonadota bacterium]NOG60597.1 Holliday junction resolvase RuvX [Pseudomonadota bacterium]
MKTLLCFDYGKKRIGTAVGQTITTTATALEIINTINNKPDWDSITRLINEWSPDQLIVGMPFQLDGSRQEMTDVAERFSRQLEGRYNIPVEMIEEQLSSYEARRELKSTYNLDAVAARLILETWLSENY